MRYSVSLSYLLSLGFFVPVTNVLFSEKVVAANLHPHCDVVEYKAPVYSASWKMPPFSVFGKPDKDQSVFSVSVPINVSAALISKPPQTPACLYEISDVTSIKVTLFQRPSDPPITFQGTAINDFKPEKNPVTFDKEPVSYSLVPHNQKGNGFQIEFNTMDDKQDTFKFFLEKRPGVNFNSLDNIRMFDFTISGNHYYRTMGVPEPSTVYSLLAFGIFGLGLLKRQV